MAISSTPLVSNKNQLQAVFAFSSRLEKECPGCQVANFQSVEKESVEILVECPDNRHLDRIAELSVEVGDQYETVIVPTPI